MIRIDEIYNNTFIPLIQSHDNKCAHFFDPFGTTDFDNLCQVPYANDIEKNFLFWDQEPIHLDLHLNTFDQFVNIFRSKRTILVTSEKESDAVNLICNRYGFESNYYFFHGWAALDWYRGYNRTFLHQPKNIQHTFLFPNNIIGGKRKHRLALFKELENRNLVENNLISFPKICPYENQTVHELTTKYKLGSIETPLPLILDKQDNYAFNSHRVDMWEQSAKSLVQVVGETVFEGNRLHLTEKSFKPVVLQQPFIIASCRGSLEYLRSYGFETFSSVWDESYDGLPDDQRISAIGNLLQELEHSNCREWLSEQCAPIAEHNYNWFYGGGFEKILWKELEEMIAQW